jgi:hypothetical protein
MLDVLEPLLSTSMAAVIMCHPNMMADLGGKDSMVDAMIRAVMASKIATNATNAHMKLLEQSKIINDDFDARNRFISRANDQNVGRGSAERAIEHDRWVDHGLSES